MILKGENKHKDFAVRLNIALDNIGVPPKGKGRQDVVAKMFGVSQKGARKWLEGESIPRIEKLIDVSNTTKTSVEYLLTGDLNPVAIPGYTTSAVDCSEANTKPTLSIKGKIPIISWSTAGDWGEVVDNFSPNDADGFVTSTVNVSDQAFALKIVGESMQPTIPDGATVIVDPNAQYRHRSIVIVRQNGDTEATCKRLIIEGETKYLQPDNDRYPVMKMMDDAVICGVVKQVSIEFD